MILKGRDFGLRERIIVFILGFILANILSLKVFSQTRDRETFSIPSFVQLAKNIKPSVVNIYTTRLIKGEQINPHKRIPKKFWDKDFFDRFFENVPERETKRRSLGSGLIIDKEGYIVTNNHVIENADEIKVSLSNDKEFDAKMIGKDTKTDLALIKIEPTENLPVPKLGNSDKLDVGEWVIAIGNPFGLEQTVTAGIVSAKGRVIGIGPYDDFIQTDASINPGNSGGPLINTKGEVIGINSLIFASVQGLGFAIPINMARDIINQLKEKGKVTRGWLGVLVQKITPELSAFFKIPDEKGALVGEVIKDGPAYKAGFQRGDVIIKFDDKNIDEMNELPKIVALTPVGKEVEVNVIRDGKERAFKVKIEELLEEKLAMEERNEEVKSYGMVVEELTEEDAKKYGVSEPGVFVLEVKGGSLAEEAGVQVGDQIIEVNKREIKNLKDYKKAVRNEIEKGVVLLLVKRDGNSLYIALRAKENKD